MSVFDGRCKTATRIRLDGDAWKPSMGSLQASGNVQESALIHKDAEIIVEGNRKSSVRGDRTYLTGGNCTTTVAGNQTIRELSDSLHLTLGKRQSNVMGPFVATFVGAAVVNYISPLTETHCCPRNVSEPTTWFENVQNKLQQYGMELSAAPASINLLGAEFNVKAAAFDLNGVSCGHSVFSLNKEDAKVVIHAHCYTRMVVTNIQVSALMLLSGTSVSAGPKLAPNSICL
ncbi:MAG: hypothetical protein ACUVS7_04905 [Bryobacteraceae bacterium]